MACSKTSYTNSECRLVAQRFDALVTRCYNEATMASRPFNYRFYKTTAEAWEAMYQAMLHATQSIYWEIFIFADHSKIGQRFIELLEKKAAEGIEVKLIIDGVGSIRFARDTELRLKKAQVELLKYNQIFPSFKITSWIRRITNRNHRKVLIVDESIGFLGGVNVSDHFNAWDDIYLEITGRVLRPLLRGFAKSYVSAGGDKQKVNHLLHPKFTSWRNLKSELDFILHSPTYRRRSLMYKMYIRGLAMAERTVNLVTPYYLPDKKFLRAIALAKKRGVKVNIFLPLRTDHRFIDILGKTYYKLTTDAGASIYTLPNMNHAKAMSVDDQFGSVGSLNLTRRGMRFDEEVGVSFTDTHMVGDLNKLFNTWKESAQLYSTEPHMKRPLGERVQQWLAKKIEHLI